MANVGRRATNKLFQLLESPAGLSENLAAVTELEGIILPKIHSKQVYRQNAPSDLVERSLDVRYPTIHLYCEKISNTLREKFRTFSGKANLAIEVRISRDRLEGLEALLEIYVETVTRILDQNRGSWGHGMFYTGGYDVTFSITKHGGRNFLQTGKITFEVAVSID